MEKQKRYLITGGAGFIGSALVKRMVADGFHVRVFDNCSRGSVARLADCMEHIEWIQGDICSSAEVLRAAAGMDSVIHLAYINGTEFFYTKPDAVLDVAIRGMLNVVDACREHGIRDLVLASSSEVYQQPPIIPTPEDVPLVVPDVFNPRYSYGGGKILCELMAINYGRKYFDRVVIFRPHNVYGPDMGWEHVIPQLVLRARDLMGKQPAGTIPFQIQGDGTDTRAFVHITDFTDGLMRIIQQGEHLTVYHIGTDEEVSIRQLVQEIFAILGRECELIFGERPVGNTPRRCPDISRLRGLGYEPRLPLVKGLPDIVEWYMKCQIPTDKQD